MTGTERLRHALTESVQRGLSTVWWLTTIMVPASAVVLILRLTGMLDLLSRVLAPVMGLLNLPGSAAIALLSGAFINLYPVIAIASELTLSSSQLATLAVFALIAHNLPVEVLVTRKTGTPVARMLALRLAAATLVSAAVARLMPALGAGGAGGGLHGSLTGAADSAGAGAGAGAVAGGGAGAAAVAGQAFSWQSLAPIIGEWALSTALTTARIALIVLVLTVATRLLNEFGVMAWLARRLRPLTALFGLPAASGGPWIVANTLGLAYGAAVLIDEAESGRLSSADGDLLNHHLGISHSLLEDTLLFVAIGAPAAWIVFPRLAAATLAVWERRGERRIGWSGG